MSLKEGLPLYTGGIFLIAIGILFLSSFSIGYNILLPILVFVSAGLILTLGWILHFDKDNKEFDNGGGGGGHIFLEKPPNPT